MPTLNSVNMTSWSKDISNTIERGKRRENSKKHFLETFYFWQYLIPFKFTTIFKTWSFLQEWEHLWTRFPNVSTTTKLKILKILEFTFFIWGKHIQEFALERMQKLISLKGVYFWCTQFLHCEYTRDSLYTGNGIMFKII